MKRKSLFFSLIIGVLFASLILQSCQGFGDYIKQQFPEFDTTTYVMIDGELMAPLVNSTKYISDFLPQSQDTTAMWIEGDNEKLIHIKAKQDSVFSITGADLGVTVTLPANTPFGPVPLPPIVFEQALPMPSNMPGNIKFGGVKVTVITTNYLTVNVDANIDSIKFFNSQTGQTAFYKTDIAFSLTAANGTTPSIDTIVIDSTNFPSLGDALAIKPDKIRVVISGNVPSQTTTGDLSPNLSTNADLLIDLPLYLYAKDIVLADTTTVDLPISDSIVQDILVKAVVENSIPLGGKVYMAFVDTLVTDTLAVLTNPDFANSTDTLNVIIGGKLVTLRPVINMKPAETDLSGLPITPVVSVSKIHLTHDNIVNLQNYSGQKGLLIFAKFNTYNSDQGQFVKILSTNYVNIKLGAKVQYATSF